MEVFNRVIGYCAKLEDEQRIERFDVLVLRPGGGPNGLLLLYGTHRQLDAVQEDERFLAFTLDAQLVVDELGQTEGWANAGVAQPMGRFQDALSTTPRQASA